MTQKDLAVHMIQGVKETFQAMIPIPLSIGKITSQNREELVDCISAVVGIAGSISVLVDICCTKPAALEIASALLDEKVAEMNEEVLDAVGELANLLAGTMKGKLSTPNSRLELTVPFVISGDRYTIKRPVNSLSVQVPFLLNNINRFEFTVVVR